MLKTQRLNIYLVALFLALGNIVWFADFTLGTLKMALMAAIAVLNVRVFLNPRNYAGICWFLALAPFLVLTAVNSAGTAGERIYWLYGFAENYFFMVLGYAYFRRGEDISRILKMTIPFTVFFSLLIIGNFAVGIPHWFSPIAKAAYTDAVNGGYIGAELAPMYSTGFGIARTGWATTLCSYLPLTLLLVRRSRLFYPSYICVALTAILSASRGGLFLTLLITAILFMKSKKGSAFKAVAVLSLVAIFIFIMPYIADIERFLRLTGGVISTSPQGARRSMSAFPTCCAREASLALAYTAPTTS